MKTKKSPPKMSQCSCLEHSFGPSAGNGAPQNFLENRDFCWTLLNSIGDELMVIDQQARIVFVNKATVRNLGFKQTSELLGRKITEFFQEKITVRKWQNTHFADLKKTGKPAKYQIKRINRKGLKQTIDISAVYLPLHKAGYILSIARDVTDLIKLQKNLKEAVDFYHLLCEGAGDPIVIINLAGKITYANRATEEQAGIKVGKLIGKSFYDFIRQEHLSQVKSFLNKSVAQNQQYHIEFDFLDAEKVSVPSEVTISPIIQDHKTSAIHLIIRNVSQRKQLERMYRESEGMKAVSFFISGTAQELKHPQLTVLRKTDALLRKYRDRDFEYIGFKEFRDMIGSLEAIREQVKYCYETTDRLLSLNKKKLGFKGKGCQPNKVIREVLRVMKNDIGRNEIRLRTRLKKDLPLIRMDETEFHHVMSNLARNAIQAMPGGGQLIITTVCHLARKQVQVDITDSGIGISHENLQHIFDPFYTTKARGINKNAGLGLPIAYSLVKSSQGEIDVESSLRKGTRIRLVLPVSRTSSR